jgi:hypothetical protein
MLIPPYDFYIIENFTTQKQIDDYIVLIKALHKQGQLNPILRPYGYDVFIGEGGFDFEDIPANIVPSTNWWASHTPPTMSNIIQPTDGDSLWKKVRVKAVQAAIINKSPKPSVADAEILSYLRRFYDKYIPNNIPLDNPAVARAWRKFYDEDKFGGAGGPGEGVSLFGNWFALGVFIDYVAVRLQSYDVDKKEFPPKGTDPDPGTGTEAGRDVDEDYALRYSVLEEFLTHAMGSYTPVDATATGSVFNTYAARNDVQLWDPSLSERDEFVIFQKIFAPAKDSKILENSIKFQKTLFAKIESTGLLDLLVQSDQIRQFGRDRFANEESAKASAGKVVRRR